MLFNSLPRVVIHNTINSDVKSWIFQIDELLNGQRYSLSGVPSCWINWNHKMQYLSDGTLIIVT